jgi:hypothetical protein
VGFRVGVGKRAWFSVAYVGLPIEVNAERLNQLTFALLHFFIWWLDEPDTRSDACNRRGNRVSGCNGPEQEIAAIDQYMVH